MVEAWAEHGTAGQIETALAGLPGTADPDLALAGFNELVRVRPGLFAELEADPAFAQRLIAMLGSSVALNQHLGTHPDDVAEVLKGSIERRVAAELRRELLTALDADPGRPTPVADPSQPDDLRRAYRRALLRHRRP